MPGRNNCPRKPPRKTHVARHHAAPPTKPPPLLEPPPEWSALGTELAAIGPHRIALALRVARAAAAGGAGVSPEEEQQLAAWMAGIVDLAVARGGKHAAAAIWHVLAGDFVRAPDALRPPRCPSMAALKQRPGDRDFAEALRAAAPGYMRTAIAGASPDELATLRAIVSAGDATLDGFRPWGISAADDHSAHEDLGAARATLTRRYLSNDAACRGIEAWASGSSNAAAGHAIPPVLRIGAIAWLARVVLHEGGIPDPEPARARLVAHQRRLIKEVGEVREERAA